MFDLKLICFVTVPIFNASSVPDIIRNPEACVQMTWLATEIEHAWFQL
jgi:tellurite resistance-related uncharacterized protein